MSIIIIIIIILKFLLDYVDFNVFLVYFWLIVTFWLHALIVLIHVRKCLASEKMWENFNLWVLYFPVWLMGKWVKF